VAHPSIEAILGFFEYGHLPPNLRAVSQPFHGFAHWLVSDEIGLDGPELTVALRKLLESKDCAVRAALSGPPLPRPQTPSPMTTSH
jgi:hypothetical protein